MSDVRRGFLNDERHWIFVDDPSGTHALMPWEEYEQREAEIERLREKIKQLNLLVDEREEQEAEIAGWKR